MQSDERQREEPGGRFIPLDECLRLHEIDQRSFEVVMSAPDLSLDARIALAGFKKRYNKSRWMQEQNGYLQRACLGAASGTPEGLALCRCGMSYKDSCGRWRKQVCGYPHLCPSCNLHKRVDPAKWEYLPAFDRAPFWYAIVVSWKHSPEESGLHWVTKQDEAGGVLEEQTFAPWRSRKVPKQMPRLSLDNHLDLGLQIDALFEFVDETKEWLSGVYAHLEWHFSFQHRSDGLNGGSPEVFHTALPHLHCFATSSRQLTFEDGKALLHRYFKTVEKVMERETGKPRLPAFPDLWISRIQSKEALTRWINYNIKTNPVEEFYRRALRVECPQIQLNHEFHQTVWCIKNMRRSPRKYGNLRPGTNNYIGAQQYRKLTKRESSELKLRMEDGSASDSDWRRFEKHEMACAQKRQHAEEVMERRKVYRAQNGASEDD